MEYLGTVEKKWDKDHKRDNLIARLDSGKYIKINKQDDKRYMMIYDMVKEGDKVFVHTNRLLVTDFNHGMQDYFFQHLFGIGVSDKQYRRLSRYAQLVFKETKASQN